MKDEFVKGQLLDGRFLTLAPLNHGSFGMVFLAQDTLTGEEVAIKCTGKIATAAGPATPFALATDERSEELVCHSILKSHDHLVNLIHHFETKSHTYLVLEYCSQGDLYEAIRLGRGPLETEHVREFMLQLVSAVEYMHSHGLYHRDIKPENIFLTQDGSMKLGDFGLATKSLWSYESCVGSDRYMAPEQYDPAGSGYSPAKADIWSIGICLLNILFSRNPFVTPTDSDILFADYRRDRQSLFDVFPNMSQDTFEILTSAMAIDPKKRDLNTVREAIIRTVCFTTDDDNFDEFCTEERDVVRASANREPLRTPSIQSPQVNAGDSFPWAKALHKSPPQPTRQLSAIPDTEAYEDEDLFPASEKGLNLGQSWFSVHANTPSLASVLDSGFGASFKSMAIRRPEMKRSPPRPDPVPITGSLPIASSKPIPTMSTIFGKKQDTVSKSWSDMWEEDESEQEEAALANRREQNARSWSQESQDEEVAVRPGVLTETKSRSSLNARRRTRERRMSTTKPSGSPNENDPFGFKGRSPKQSPGKQSPTDKWAALGNKRRSYQPAKETQASTSRKRSTTTGWRKENGMGSSGFDYSAWHRRDSRGGRPAWMDHDWRRDQQPLSMHKPSYDGSADMEDHEWVGGWHAFHL